MTTTLTAPSREAGTPVVSRDDTTTGRLTGGNRHCQLEGCGGLRLGTRWPDGKLTWPCLKGMTWSADRGAWRIE